MNRKTLFLAGVWMLLSWNSMAQEEDRLQEYRLQQEHIKRTELMRQLDSGIYYMDLEKYELADQKFKHVLKNIKGVPSDLTFYFGKNSFFLGNFKQSIDWLNKYIQLKGTNGQYSAEAVQLLKKAETGLVAQKKQDTEKTKQLFSYDYDIDCGPTGKVLCPICKGSTVIVKKGAFGDEYRSCSYCNKHGTLSCDEYNKLVRGELKSSVP